METWHLEVNPVGRAVGGALEMLEPETVTAIVRLEGSGGGAKLAPRCGESRNTARRYL